VLNPATNTLDNTTHFLNPNGCASFAAYQANQCLYRPLWQIQPQTGNLNLLGRFTKNLGGDWQAVVTGSLFRSESEQVGGNQAPYAFLNGVNTTTLTTIGPHIIPTPITYPQIVLPPGSPNNPFPAYGASCTPATCGGPGQPPTPLAGGGAALVADFPQLGMSQTQFVTNTYRFFGELRGSAAGWDLDGTAGWMYAALEQTFTGNINPSLLATAAANGFNFANATPQLMEQTFAAPQGVKDTNSMQVVDFHGTRELMQLPGGALSLALGVGYNHLYKNSLAPATGGADAIQLITNNAFALGGQSNQDVYMEFVAPVVKGLEIDLAGRYDHYPQYGSSTTPKFGIKYSPFKMLTLRGTYGKGFRAPNPAEAGQSGSLFGGFAFTDPVLCPSPGNVNTVGNFPNQCVLPPVGLQVANPHLEPEKSTNYTAGFIFQPFDSTSISVDYWDIKVNQDIQSGVNLLFIGGNAANYPIIRGPTALEPECTNTPLQPAPPAPAIPCTTQTVLTPVGLPLFQTFPYVNATQTHVSGLDLDTLNHFDIGSAGKITAQLNASYTFHYIFGLAGSAVDLAGSHGPSIISGDTGNPKIRATASLGWDLGPVNVTASLNYVGRFNLLDPTAGFNDCATAIAFGALGGRFANGGAVSQTLLNSYCEVKSFTDVDLYAQYAFSKSFSVHGSILNVFGTQPPVDANTYGASGNDPYNPAMHQMGAVGRFFNVGGTYTF
jgi:iron complex outermembrane receptor protein